MSAQSPDRGAIDALNRLRATLDRIGDALVSRDTDALLETELQLNAELGRLSALRHESDRHDTMAAADRVRLALLRCRRLGASLTAVTRVMTQAGDGYDRTGDHIGNAAIGPALRIRV